MTVPAVDDLDEVLALAANLSGVGAHRRAHEVLMAALVRHPDEPVLLRETGRAEVRLRLWQPAAQHAHAALGQQPGDADAMRIYAVALSGLGRRAEGLWMAWRAVHTAPDDYLTHLCYAQLLHSAGCHRPALAVVGESLRLQPEQPGAWSLQGSILQDLGHLPGSDASYRQALALQPENAVALHDMSLNRLKQGQLSSALSGFRGAGRIDPDVGSVARTNVAATLTVAMNRVTLATTAAGLAVTAAVLPYQDVDRPAGARLLAALVAVALLGMSAFVARMAPVASWRSAIRLRPFLAVRMGHVAIAIVAAAAAAVVPGRHDVIFLTGPAIMLSGILVYWIGILAGR